MDVCYSGTEGLDNALSGIYDLMLLDVMLPGLDGFTVLERLRGSGSRLPVLMLTARGELSDRVCGLDRGCRLLSDQALQSPELLACVRLLLRRQAGTATVDDTIRWGDLRCCSPAPFRCAARSAAPG
ncbi:MAG: response regulator [Oscillospiraceae bacterium]